MHAITTVYKGYRFRSRLEARWAVYFDALGLKWEYEPQGYDLDGTPYLPDFWLPQVSSWAEVKPVAFTEAETAKANALVRLTGFPCVLLVGTPACQAYELVEYWDECFWPTDCVVSMAYDHLYAEHRFHVGTGGTLTPDDFKSDGMFSDVHTAVLAARSARFEFGESGARPRYRP